jgi:hypothetical protein
MVEKDEKEKVEGAEETDAPEDRPTGDKPEEDEAADKPDPGNERLDRIERTLDRMERAGIAEAGVAEPKKKEVSPEQFAQDFAEGKVPNPLKE